MKKITNDDLVNRGVVGLPDTPGLPYPELQRKFDEIGKEVIVPKFNGLIDDLSANTGASEIGATNPFSRSLLPDVSVQDVLNSTYDKYEYLQEKIGEVDGSLVEYVDGKFETTEGHINSFAESFDMRISKVEESKVDVEPGKGLSQNDFSNEYVAEISDLETKKHTHENKSVLDTITSTLLSAYNRLLTLFGTITELDKASLTDDDGKIPTSKAVVNYISGKDGVMLKSVYDKNNDGVVDTAKEAYALNYFGNTYSAEKFLEEIEKTQKNTYFMYPIQTTVNSFEGGLGVMSIDGDSYQAGANGKNLLIPTLSSTASNGITATKREDGTILLNGTATANVYITIAQNVVLKAGTYKIIATNNPSTTTYRCYINSTSEIASETTNNGVFTLASDTTVSIMYKVTSGITLSNEIIKPMISTDTSVTYADYEPCIAPSQPQPIHSVGDMGCLDLGSFEWIKESAYWVTSYTGADMKRPSSTSEVPTLIHSTYKPRQATGISGVGLGTDYIALSTASATIYCTSTDKPSGLLMYEVADGQTPSQYGMAIRESDKNLYSGDISTWKSGASGYLIYKLKTNGVCTMSLQNMDIASSKLYFYAGALNDSGDFVTSDDRFVFASGGALKLTEATITPNADGYIALVINSANGINNVKTVVNNLLSTLQIEVGTSASDYVQHKEKTTIIPLSAPLRKIGDAYDYIDVKNGKIVRKIKTSDLGTLSYGRTGSRFYSSGITDGNAPSSTVKANILCPTYTATTRTDVEKNDFSISFVHTNDGDYINLYDTGVSDASQLKTKLNGVLLYYELATPTIEPLTDEQKSALAELVTYKDKTTLDLTVGLNESVYPEGMFYYGSSDVVAQTIKNTNDNIILNAKLNKLLNQ